MGCGTSFPWEKPKTFKQMEEYPEPNHQYDPHSAAKKPVIKQVSRFDLPVSPISDRNSTAERRGVSFRGDPDASQFGDPRASLSSKRSSSLDLAKMLFGRDSADQGGTLYRGGSGDQGGTLYRGGSGDQGGTLYRGGSGDQGGTIYRGGSGDQGGALFRGSSGGFFQEARSPTSSSFFKDPDGSVHSGRGSTSPRLEAVVETPVEVVDMSKWKMDGRGSATVAVA